MRVKFVAGVLVSCLLLSAAAAREASVNPGINSYYMNPDYAKWVAIFESPQREIYSQRKLIVNSLKLKPGMAVADIGAGTGFLSLMIADKVGKEGKVYAVDIARGFVDNLLLRAEQQQLSQVVGVVNDPASSGLAPESIDLALICDTYHHFEFPRSVMASLHAALRPDGEIVLIDYRKIPGLSSAWVMDHVRVNQQQVIEEIESDGFKLVADENILSSNYFLRFKKMPAAEK